MAAGQNPVVSCQMIVLGCFAVYSGPSLSCDKFIARMKSSYQQGFPGIFTIQAGVSFSAAAVPRIENQGCLRKIGVEFPRVAPGTRQAAVDGLHSIDFPADKTPGFLLTLKMKGVKTNSFFDSF